MTPSSVEPLLELMQILPRDRILELDCGEGEVSVLLAARAPEGVVVALDPSDDRVRRSRARARDLDNVMFLLGSAAQIPWKEDFFSKALSHRFCPDLADVLRVLAPDGLFYLTAASSPDLGGAVAEPSSPSDQIKLVEAAGFCAVQVHRLPGNHTVLVARKPA